MVKSEDILKDDQSFVKTESGTLARKGSVAAMLLNASVLDELLPQLPSSAKEEEVDKILTDIRSLMPTLHAIHLFDFFSPLEWLQAKPRSQEGRIVIALLYLQQYPQLMNRDILNRLQQIKEQVSLETKQEIEQLLRLAEHSASTL